MATKTIPQLTALGANVAVDDQFEISDTSNSDVSRRVTQAQILQGLVITPAASTLAIASGKTFTVSNTLTFTGTDSSSVAFGAGGTVLYSGGNAGTPSAIVLTNATGLPTAGIVDDAVTLAKIANAAASSKLVGSGASGSGANYVEITLGTNLSMSGTTLNATGGGGGSGTVTVVSSGSLTSTAIMTGGGSTECQTPSTTATLNSSGDISTPGDIACVDLASSGTATFGAITDLGTPGAGILAGCKGLKTTVKITAANYTAGTTDATECYGGAIFVTSAATITLPAVVAGMSLAVFTKGAIAVSVDPNGADLIIRDGTAQADGEKITNLSTAGDCCVLYAYDSTGWYASTNAWTNGG